MNLTLIPSPFALDQHRISMGQAPEALMAHGLAQALERDGHTVRVAGRELDLGGGSVLDRIGRNGAILAGAVEAAHRAGSLPVILGGDCLVAVGVVAGLRRALSTEFGVAWFDAHGDFNTPETTLSGYLGGMPLACACGRGLAMLREKAGLARPVDEANVSMIGIRDLDPPEKALLDTTPIRIYTPADAPQFAASGEAGARPAYLHFDIDCVDPAFAPGVNFLTPHGLTPDQAIAAARPLRPHLAAFSLTAVDPERDRESRTARTAVDILRGVLAG